MKKYFALIVLMVVVLSSYFYVENLSSVINKNDVHILEISNSYSNEVLHFDKDKLQEILNCLDLEIHSENLVADRMILEGYSQKLNNYVVVNNLKTNIQIAISDDEIIVGYPLISGSF